MTQQWVDNKFVIEDPLHEDIRSHNHGVADNGLTLADSIVDYESDDAFDWMASNESPMTSFEEVSDMNSAFGNAWGNPDDIDWHRLKNQCKNIYDEYLELMSAIEAKDIAEVRDGLCDIKVFADGGYHMIGYDADADMHQVYLSNMSKFIVDEEMEKATVAKYGALAIETYLEGQYPLRAIKSSKEQTDSNGTVYRANKFLKSTGFFQPAFL